MIYRWRLILLFMLCPVVQPALASSDNTGVEVAQDFTLRALSGVQYSLKSLQQDGHVLLLFWSMDCIYCQAQMSEYQRVYAQYRDRGLVMAAINLGGEYYEDILGYREQKGLEFLFLSNRQHNMKVAETYRVTATPTLILVSPEGEIVYRGHVIPELNKWLPGHQHVQKQDSEQEEL